MHVAGAGAIKSAKKEKAGEAIQLAMDYLISDGKDITIAENIRDEGVRILFGTFKEWIDEAVREHDEAVKNGKKGAEEREKKRQQALDKYGSDESMPNRSTLEEYDPLRPP